MEELNKQEQPSNNVTKLMETLQPLQSCHSLKDANDQVRRWRKAIQGTKITYTTKTGKEVTKKFTETSLLVLEAITVCSSKRYYGATNANQETLARKINELIARTEFIERTPNVTRSTVSKQLSMLERVGAVTKHRINGDTANIANYAYILEPCPYEFKVDTWGNSQVDTRLDTRSGHTTGHMKWTHEVDTREKRICELETLLTSMVEEGFSQEELSLIFKSLSLYKSLSHISQKDTEQNQGQKISSLRSENFHPEYIYTKENPNIDGDTNLYTCKNQSVNSSQRVTNDNMDECAWYAPELFTTVKQAPKEEEMLSDEEWVEERITHFFSYGIGEKWKLENTSEYPTLKLAMTNSVLKYDIELNDVILLVKSLLTDLSIKSMTSIFISISKKMAKNGWSYMEYVVHNKKDKEDKVFELDKKRQEKELALCEPILSPEDFTFGEVPF